MMPDAPDTKLRTVCSEDQDFLYHLYSQSRFDFHMVDWPSEDVRAQFTRMQYDAQRRHYEEHYPGSVHQIIVRTDGPAPVRVGRIWTFYGEEHILILDMNILPDHQSQGIGSALINDKKQEAREQKIPLRHDVEKTNQDAIRLYKRLNFSISSSIDTHFGMVWLPKSLRE